MKWMEKKKKSELYIYLVNINKNPQLEDLKKT